MADKKITALVATTSVVAADVFPIVVDTAGTPTTKKIASSDLSSYVLSTAAVTQSANDNSTKVATTAYVATAVAANVVDFSSDQNVLSIGVFS